MKIAVLVVVGLISAIAYVAGWIRSDAVTNHRKVASGVSVGGLGCLVLVMLGFIAQVMLP